ncbi:Gfo/Idh/MocA family protein [Microlunatus sp. Gsoil 973]|uniref:Gfo/Idh/MocA family protein n=1 Tax=Microlunatus sp. Gsoil 973 TaxID=2672569 RepID=UPI0012B50476|nr:Gfo/Idh/MocA family oxidoreductase [Microlunatus sp. Gsoil 973]QGN34683.1 gfo/Idh/MocA family oxidoreductase [Microlunatus sp. Gsoil 973]
MTNGVRKVAVLGAGMIGEVHRRAAVLAGAEVVGVMASTPERSQEVAAQWGVAKAYGTIDEVVADDLDVVHICTPNASHVPYAVAALEAGKHVVCEKPLGVSLADAQHAAEVAERTGLINTMPFAYRFHPMAREMRARVQDGGFGAPNLIHGSYLQDWLLDPRASSWRVDPQAGGPSRAFGDIGSHWCDLAEWVTAERITEVVADTSIAIKQRPAATAASFSAAPTDAPLADVTTEDSALILFRTDRGTSGSAVISQLAAGRKNRLWLEVDGASHSAVFDQEHAEELWIGGEDQSLLLVRDPNHGASEQRRLSHLPAGHAQGYAQCFENFVADTYAAIDGEAPEGLPTFADGLRAAQICDAMLRSAESRKWETV